MIKVNSLSGGKTSSYMAVHYPADINIFALVCIEAEYCRPKDAGIVKYVSDKIGRDFIATAESDKTLYVMRDLEQIIGREITWVAGETFEGLIRRKKALPNIMARWCTQEMKLRPIIDHCWHKYGKVEMRIGFRHDEDNRVAKNRDNVLAKVIVGKSSDGLNKWKEVEWRSLSFPLFDDGVSVYPVHQWVKTTQLDFPPDSNCVFCFHKAAMQLRKNWDDEPLKMRWAMEMEELVKRRWKRDISAKQIRRLGLQLDFFYGTGSGCASGFCTD